MNAQFTSVMSDSMDSSPPVSSVHGILQVRILEWIAMLSSRGLPDPGIEPVSLVSPAWIGRFFSTSASWETQIYKCLKLKRSVKKREIMS